MLRNELNRLFDERGLSRPNVTKILDIGARDSEGPSQG